MNQPHMATWWFPSNDHPSDKALMDISITVPRGKQVFANGRRISIKRHGGLATHRWRAAEPMSTYLAMFAAGRLPGGLGRPGRPPVAGRGVPAAVTRRAAGQHGPHAADAAHRGGPRGRPRRLSRSVRSAVWSPPSMWGSRWRTRPCRPTRPPGVATPGWSSTSSPTSGSATRWGSRRWKDIWLNEGAATFMEVRWDETHGGTSGADWLARGLRPAPRREPFLGPRDR